MTRSAGDVEIVRALYEAGHSALEISRQTGIPRSTLRQWIRDQFIFRRPGSRFPIHELCDPCEAVLNLEEEPYAYLLGLYLGDGCIATHPRSYKLRISLDQKYPNIIAECKAAMAAMLPNSVGAVQRPGCIEVTSYSQHWPCFFPQHGPGPKHLRPIILEPWQKWIAVERHPRLLLRGLIHSDGCRATNKIRTRSGRYEYPRYMFSNRSADIRSIFTLACRRAAIECRPSNAWTISVSKSDSVKLMDSFIGPKT